MAQVKIGPNFFRNELKAYSDWRWSWPREILQNSIDCHSSNIAIQIAVTNDGVLVSVENDGDPMTEDILVNKLLALGESGKNFAGTVGGYGQAKVILYFSQQSYRIHSGDNLVVGCGGDYDLTKTAHLHGTKSEVIIRDEKMSNDDLASTLIRKFKSVIIMTQRPAVRFTVNGEEIPATLKKGSRRRSLSWGTVYTNKTFEHRLIVRVGGTPMFTKYIDIPKTVVVEIEGTSCDCLTSNRDGLLWRYQDQLDEFMRELAVNRRSALEEQTTSYIHYKGDKLEAKNQTADIYEVLTAAYAAVQTLEDITNNEEDGPTIGRDIRPVIETIDPDCSFEESNKRLPQIGFDFLIRNELGMAVPAHLVPETFGEYSRKLIKSWAACMLELHRLFGDTNDFSIGFVLSESAEAMHEKSSTYGTVLYVNPIVVKKNSFGGRSLARRWKFTPDGKMAILAAALHEYCHRHHQSHNNDFADFLTGCTAVVLRNISRFHRCFNNKTSSLVK